MVSATQTTAQTTWKWDYFALFTMEFFTKKRDCKDVFRELNGSSQTAVTTGKRNNGTFRYLTEKFLWDSLNLQKLLILQKHILQRETELEALKALAFPSCAWDEGTQTPHSSWVLFLKMLIWRLKSWGQTRASLRSRSWQLSTAPPALVLSPQHCWSTKCPHLVVQAIGQGKIPSLS